MVSGRLWGALGSVAALALVATGWWSSPVVAVGAPAQSPALVDTLAALRSNTPAHKDYLLHCAGCHGLDGAGAPRQGVPDFRHSAGVFTRTASAREYLIRVPGSSGSLLTDQELANVLNWIVAEFGADAVAPDFHPFSAGEVHTARPHFYTDPAIARKQVAKELLDHGLTVAPYHYGKHPGFGTQPAEGR